ncbi:MED14-domain-containing protein [Artomyces pyxidatus]|uniref:MED14-domain-containing protein n=1 Tax=Artomyces pyxidatus TaxID=48021 RepID=A0ACB8TKC0_9AGAM|nr:MED14-domain-containing protein [Artomyces pyxidatus]
MALNGTNLAASTSQPPPPPDVPDSVVVHMNGFGEPSLEAIESKLPVVYDGQVPLGEVVSRVVQACYAEMSEMAETLPSMSDSARKRKLADFVVAWKKQIVKLYAVAKWSRDADIVQKCMNITAFLMNQNRQFEDVIHGLLRNHDLLTSLDVLTTGSYRRLPTGIKKSILPPTPLTDEEVLRTLHDVEALIRYRLRIKEIIPVEMSKYRIADGRAFFAVPKLFEVSLSVRGGQKDDGWFFVNVEFLFNVGGDLTGMQEFPRKPTGVLKQHLTNEADARLAFYLPPPADQPAPPPGVEPPPIPKLPDDVVDAPLIRMYNFLQMMSMSYQLEILWFQANRLRSLGWADYLSVEMSRDRKTLTVSYWIRQPPARPPPPSRFKLPLVGGTLTISLVNTPDPLRAPKSRVLAELQERSKLTGSNKRPSDMVEGARWDVKWEPTIGALGVKIKAEDSFLRPEELTIDAENLDLERLLLKVIEKHTASIFDVFLLQLQYGTVFSVPEEVSVVREGGSVALRAYLCDDELVIVTIDPRTGRLNLRDTGDLGAAGRGPRFTAISEKINENPGMLLDALVRLRMNTIIELAEQKANYLGLVTFRLRNFSKEEQAKLGPSARSLLHIQLTPYPNHYIMLVLTDNEFRYALISVHVIADMYQSLVMDDIGWLEVEKICGRRDAIGEADVSLGKRKREAGAIASEVASRLMVPRFRLETHVLRELYAYCCARVAHTKVEQQFKANQIPYTHVYPSSPAMGPILPSSLKHLHSSLSQTIPTLCVQSADILSGSPAFEAAMPNIRVIPLSWWSTSSQQYAGERPPKVVTCVKLKNVQQPVGRRAGAGKGVIRPSKRIVYDANEAVVCFLSEEVEGCVQEFVTEWASVSKIVVIAREVARMAKEKRWQDVRLLSFDLQTVEFAYASDYTVSITCTDQLSANGGSYDLYFSRLPPSSAGPTQNSSGSQRPYNPHTEAEPFLHNLLSRGKLSQTLPALVAVLRSTVPILEVLEEIRAGATAPRAGDETPEIDTFAKAAGWWRVLFGTGTGHGLDFRLLTGGRVAILDACYPVFGRASPSVSSSPSQESLGLQPIPGLRHILAEAVKATRGHGRAADVNVGIVCGVGDVVTVGRKVWEGISRDVVGGRMVVKEGSG